MDASLKEFTWRHLLAFALVCLIIRQAGIALHRSARDRHITFDGSPAAPATGTKALTLIILFNHPPRPGVVQFVANLYSPYFYQIVFSGPEPFQVGTETLEAAAVVDSVQTSDLYFEGQRYVLCHGDHAGYFGYWCVAQVLQGVEDIGAGALYAGDDAALNITALQRYPIDQLWTTFEFSFVEWREEKRAAWYWWSSTIPISRDGKTYTVSMGYEALRYALSSLSPEFVERLYAERPEMATNVPGTHVLDFGLSDAYYIPVQHSKLFVTLATHFRHYNVFLEIALPHIMQILREAADYVMLRSCYLWEGDRNHDNVARVIKEGRLDVLHPIKPSGTEGKTLLAQFANGSHLSEAV